MATKKQIDDARKKAAIELFDILLALDYAIDDMHHYRDYFRENATDLTKEINKKKRVFNSTVKKYEELTGRSYNPHKGKF